MVDPSTIQMTTMGIAMGVTDGSIWKVGPNGAMTEVWGGPGSATFQLGVGLAVQPTDELAVGWWVVAFNPAQAVLVQSDGTAEAGHSGTAYPLTVV